MTGPRIYPDNTAVSRTPRATKGLGDLLKKILYDNPKANIASLRDPVDPATIDEFLMQAAMGSVGSMDKVGGKVGEGLKKVLGVSGKGPLVQAAREPEALTGVARKDMETGKVYSLKGFERGHAGVPAPLGSEDGFVTNTGRFLDRTEAHLLLRRNNAHGLDLTDDQLEATEAWRLLRGNTRKP